MKVSNLVLGNIARKIDKGYPITAMAIANRYLSSDCPLRKALAAKARQKINPDYNQSQTSIQNIFAGKSVAGEELLSCIQQYDKGLKNRFNKKIPSRFMKRTNCRRAASRSRGIRLP